MENLRGNVALLVTPFKYNKEIDFDAYSEYVEWQAMQNPSGLFTVCGSSEMKWLNLKERIALIKYTQPILTCFAICVPVNRDKLINYIFKIFDKLIFFVLILPKSVNTESNIP